ncbi:MAG TPA: hypothetical protein VGO59_11615, partial [Verrucomicrobiae bacterium]
ARTCARWTASVRRARRRGETVRLFIGAVSITTARRRIGGRSFTAYERFAQQALGHSSKAFARAYSKNAKVIVPSLEDYEAKIVPMQAAAVA